MLAAPPAGSPSAAPATAAHPRPRTVAVIGGGPAGLMAAEVLAAHGLSVALYDAMPSVGRKFLLAGKGGMNLTHSEAFEPFAARYGERRAQVQPWLDGFGAEALRAWVHALGIETFVGSSGRVFPRDMKAAPLLRAWLHRLRAAGVHFYMRHRWLGWDDTAGGGMPRALRFATPEGERSIQADAYVIALGGASWPQLGSDGAWVAPLAQRGVAVQPLLPANCGFEVEWSAHFSTRFAGQPLKSVAIALAAAPAPRQGECLVTAHGIEGSLIYALSAQIRTQCLSQGGALLSLDLLPGWSHARVLAETTHARGARSLSSHLQSRLGIHGVKAGLLYECLDKEVLGDMTCLAAALKALPLRVTRPRPIAEAISSAGGVDFAALDAGLMLKALPGMFCAGEMLDWEAPTGGYLLTACLASGRVAAQGVLAYLNLGA
jgi:uncharacterized flavoprotein (TIGR03862 family)